MFKRKTKVVESFNEVEFDPNNPREYLKNIRDQIASMSRYLDSAEREKQQKQKEAEELLRLEAEAELERHRNEERRRKSRVEYWLSIISEGRRLEEEVARLYASLG